MTCPLVLFLFTVWSGMKLTVRLGGATRQIAVIEVIVTAGLSALAAMVLLRVLQGRTRHAVDAWTAAVVAAWLISLMGPLAAVTASTTGTLMAMHTMVAVVILAAGRRSRVPMTHRSRHRGAHG